MLDIDILLFNLASKINLLMNQLFHEFYSILFIKQ